MAFYNFLDPKNTITKGYGMIRVDFQKIMGGQEGLTYFPWNMSKMCTQLKKYVYGFNVRWRNARPL